MMPRLFCIFVVLTMQLATMTSAATGEAKAWESERGLFRVSFASSIEPIRINRIHEWTVHVETIDGTAVQGAILSITGGMPDHDHGLPTSPRVTAELGNGDYRVQGLRFHMRGAWSISIAIDDGVRSDTVAIDLIIQ